MLSVALEEVRALSLIEQNYQKELSKRAIKKSYPKRAIEKRTEKENRKVYL